MNKGGVYNEQLR